MTPEKSPGVYLCSARRARVRSAMRPRVRAPWQYSTNEANGRSLMPRNRPTPDSTKNTLKLSSPRNSPTKLPRLPGMLHSRVPAAVSFSSQTVFDGVYRYRAVKMKNSDNCFQPGEGKW